MTINRESGADGTKLPSDTIQPQGAVSTDGKPLRERVAEYMASRYGERPTFQDLLDADAIIAAVRAEQPKDAAQQRKRDELISALYAEANEFETLGATSDAKTISLLRAAADRLAFLERTQQAQGPVSKGKFIAIGELKMARIQVGNLPVCNEVPLIASAIDCALEALEGKALCSKCDTFTEVPS